MAYSPSSPVTGGAQTGFTSPTYTLTSMQAPEYNGIQHAVTALGGTQTGASVHAASSPFTATFVRPKQLKVLGTPVNGVLKAVPRNVYYLLIRKGMVPLSGQACVPALLEIKFNIPCGADLVSPGEIRAMVSLAAGLLSAQSAGIGDTCIAGV
jgi:hypothetical protein